MVDPTVKYAVPTPPLKYVGGKTHLLGPILESLPAKILTYYEPMLGGGAVLLALAAECRFVRAVAADTNEELINFWNVLKLQPDYLIAAVAEHVPHAKDVDYFYKLRARPLPEGVVFAETTRHAHAIYRAARMLYLNKTCFNGLYRVNKRGEFNVPFGRYAQPKVLDAPALLATSAAIQNVDFVCGDFEATTKDAGPVDAIYFDPPYYPTSPTAMFAAYTADGFGEADHVRLARAFNARARAGADCVLSNSYAPFIRGLYAYYGPRTVTAPRALNSDGKKRGAVNELLVVARGRRVAIPKPIMPDDWIGD